MNDKQNVGKLDVLSKKEIELIEKALKEKYERSAKPEKNNSKIA